MDRVLLRNSERSAFKTCRFRWAWTYGGVWEVGPIRSLQPAKALWFGDLVHQGLAGYYIEGTKRGIHPAKTFIKRYDSDDRLAAVQRNDAGEWESMRDLGRGMLEAYVEEYGDRDDEWEVIASERTFRLPVIVPAFRLPVGRYLGLGEYANELILPEFKLVVVGTFDGIWRYRPKPKRVVFKEFKTAASIKPDGLAMDDQAGYYWTYGPKWSWRQNILPKGTYPAEILYTFLRKAVRNPDKTYTPEGVLLNLDGTPSKSQPPPYFDRMPVYRDRADRENVHRRVLAEAREMMLIRAGVLDAYKNPGPLHMPNCRGCPVRDACELHETGNDWETMLNGTTETWDPYSDHEIIERR